MYLKQSYIENSGSLRKLDLTLSFTAEGAPKPLVVVGGNGGGKTNFLSIITDGLFEAAAVHYDNVLPAKGAGRSWFRVVGGRSITSGTTGGFSLLRFDDAGENRFFQEKAGQLDVAFSDRVPADFNGQINWQDGQSVKKFGIDDNRSQAIFNEGVYAYFPSSRSEVPYWLNREAIPEVEFDIFPNFSKRLKKPIYVDRALDQFKQWLMGLMADARTAIYPVGDQWGFTGDPTQSMLSTSVLAACNTLLQDIISEPAAFFFWVGRKSPEKLAVIRNGQILLPNLDALSAGQSILLGMFGTILRYGDFSQNGSQLELGRIEGICIIDEIDAHIHIELQHKVLPKLIKLFPKMQFILSSHSPLFVLGMEKEFGSDGLQIIELPSGVPVGAESYAEFGKALEALTATGAFIKKVVAETRGAGKPIVYVEGETDAPYIKRAAVLLERAALLDQCDIEWIGAKDDGGQGFHTGKDAFKHTQAVLRANPTLARRGDVPPDVEVWERHAVDGPYAARAAWATAAVAAAF